MSFLNQLKSQARALQSVQSVDLLQREANTRLTEAAATTVWLYVAELAKQLNVIAPSGPSLSLSSKTPWPAMKLVDFQVDARKKTLRDQQVFDYIALGWRLVPVDGAPVAGSVSANFPPDLQRIESRLAAGSVPHDRVHVRHPEKNTLQAIRFDYSTEARAGITITPDHEAANLVFRLANLQAFDVLTATYPAAQIQSPLLDELAKMIVGQASRFVFN
ncbi:hypothetical protein SBP18_14920 [Rhodoferax ferrireducens]|uniref:hypothetical protein n=1 Tax=Rhodoferax ferrireducens TaxID=192843 RepID=UPI00298E2D5D|nr:hypothetical protein [Rhodoferax ferrireducens]WPC65774.1 hypothetical protein SBP18_14920 [Rhodoferax ferrireducens]